MNVTIVSAFRNAVAYIPRYVAQVCDLSDLLRRRGDCLNLLLGYGDSTDGTGEALFDACANRIGALLMEVSHGGKVYPSVVDPIRFKQLAFVANKLSACIDKSADVILWIESDLIWRPETIIALIDHLATYPCVVPMVMHQDPPDRFYDRWAFAKDGINFTNEPPYHPGVNGKITSVDSAGSCVAVRAEVGRNLRFPEEDVFVGWCRQLYEQGGSIWLDPILRIEHP